MHTSSFSEIVFLMVMALVAAAPLASATRGATVLANAGFDAVDSVYAESADRAKTGTSGGRKRERGSQVTEAEALASRFSRGTERGGFVRTVLRTLLGMRHLRRNP